MRSEPLAPVGLQVAWRSSADSQSNSPLDEATWRSDRSCSSSRSASGGNNDGTSATPSASTVARDRSGLVLAVPLTWLLFHIAESSQELLNVGESLYAEGFHEGVLEVLRLVIGRGIKAEWKLKSHIG